MMKAGSRDLPIWDAQRVARLRSKLEQILWKSHRERGYEPVRGAEILKQYVENKVGHYACYGEHCSYRDCNRSMV